MGLRNLQDYVEPTNIASDVKTLSQLSFWKGVRPLIGDWMIIAGVITLASLFPSPWVYVISCILIASRQHALLVIVHEGAHYRLSNNHAFNDFIANFFAAFPVFFCTVGYRANHHKHHRYLNSDQDPDWVRKIYLSEWQFPQTKFQFSKTVGKIILTSWYKLIILFYRFSMIDQKSTYQSAAGRKLLLQKIIFYGALIFSLYQFDLLTPFFAYWMVPFLLVFPLIERMRSISEHFGLAYLNDYTQTRYILCSTLEAFLIGPHNIRYHLTHHLYQTVPQYNLPELRERLLRDADYKKWAHENDAYLFGGQKSVLKDILTREQE